MEMEMVYDRGKEIFRIERVRNSYTVAFTLVDERVLHGGLSPPGSRTDTI